MVCPHSCRELTAGLDVWTAGASPAKPAAKRGSSLATTTATFLLVKRPGLFADEFGQFESHSWNLEEADSPF